MNYKTELNNTARFLEAHQILFYSVIMILLVGYCAFGLYPFYKKILEKRQTANDLATVNVALENKKNLLIEIPNSLEGTDKYLTYLRTAIPANPSLQTYMLELATVSARSGFQQQRISLGSSSEGIADISVVLYGVPARLPILISELESMKRITEVSKVDVSERDNLGYVTLNLKVYYLE